MKNKKNTASNVENRAELITLKNKSCPLKIKGEKSSIYSKYSIMTSRSNSGQLGFTQL